MSARSRFGPEVAPLLLRFALGAVFVYAGAGKLFYAMPLAGPPAGRLVELGLAEVPTVTPDSHPDSTHAPQSEPPAPAPAPKGTDPAPAPAPAETTDPASQPPADSSPTGETTDVVPTDEPVPGPAMLPGPADLGKHVTDAPKTPAPKPPVTVELPPDTEGSVAAAFEGEISVSRRLGLVLAMDGASARNQWPSALGTSSALDALAWAAALTEFVGGWLVLIGLMTRIWALGLAGTMVVALWLTQIGPAMASGQAFLRVLPPLEIANSATWTTAWQTMFFQLTLLCAAGALVLLGAGRVSVDRFLFGGSSPRESRRAGAKGADTMSR